MIFIFNSNHFGPHQRRIAIILAKKRLKGLVIAPSNLVQDYQAKDAANNLFDALNQHVKWLK
jgi:hypothetical protein